MDFGRKSKDINMETDYLTEHKNEEEEEEDQDIRQCPYKKFKTDNDAYDGIEGNATFGTIVGGDSEGNPQKATTEIDDLDGEGDSENGEWCKVASSS